MSDENAVACVHRIVCGYDLSYENEGVFLIKHPDSEPNWGLIRHDMKRRGLKNMLRDAAIEEGLRENSFKVLVAPVQEIIECPEDILVRCTKDEMQASIIFLPASDESRMSYDNMLSILERENIKYGIDQSALKFAFDDHKYGHEYVIAHGTAAENGQDGKLINHFRVAFSNAPKEMSSGRVDYRQLDIYEPVKEGQLLITRIPPTDGTNGRSVTARELRALPGRNVLLPKGENVAVNEDSTELRAAKSGRVDVKGNRLVVSTCFTVSGDVDMSVGNINFHGDVMIGGNVIGGMTIEADRDIEINGIVEGATIIAGRNITLTKGVLGADHAKIFAGGDITAQFIERSYIRAKGSVTANTIVHSRIEVENSLFVLGTRGTLLGGTCCVCGDIAVLKAGTSAQVPTVIEVGVLPDQRERLIFLKSEIKRYERDLARIDLLYEDTQSGPPLNQNDKHYEIRMKMFRTRLKLKQAISDFKAEAEELSNKIEHTFDGKLHVCDVILPGVKIVIGSAHYEVKDPVQYATFKRKGADIIFGPCEYVKDYVK